MPTIMEKIEVQNCTTTKPLNNMTKQTAVEWLVEQLPKHGSGAVKTFSGLFQQAKEIEKKQLCDMYIQGRKDNHLDYYPEKHAKETYDEIYKKDKP